MESFQEAGKICIALFVVPIHRLLQAKDVEATAYYKLFSIAILEDDLLIHLFNVVVFEKICMFDLYVLDKLNSS